MVLLFLHILGVVLFLGNIIIAAFWKVQADLSKEPKPIHQSVKNVMLSDYVFTIPGLVLIILTGTLMAFRAGYSLSTFNWLTLSILLFVVTGLIWGFILIPLQRKMMKISAQSIVVDRISEQYWKLSRYWAVFGILATLTPISILYVMITKLN